MDKYEQALETIKGYVLDEQTLTDQIKKGEITLEQAFNVLKARQLFVDKLFVQEEHIALELIEFTADLVKDIAQYKKQQKEADKLITEQASKITILEEKIKSLESQLRVKESYKKAFDHWKNDPYWLKSPNDWPLGPAIDSLFDGILNPPHYKSDNKVK